MRNIHGKLCYKIALTGGPCSGKTTALNDIKENFEKAYDQNEWQLFTVSEASSLLYLGGVERIRMNKDQAYEWQKGILKTILHLEEIYDNLARYEDQRNTLIICDRGAMDPKVYTKNNEWEHILQCMNFTESELLKRYDADQRNTLIICDRGAMDPKVFTKDNEWKHTLQCMNFTESELLKRYDAVIRLNTAPKDAYSTRNNKSRRETYEDAKKINQAYDEIWKGHPRFYNIENDEHNGNQEFGWQRKSEKIFNIIQQILENK